jgi:acyl-coenzyme A thioesterase PaaI-like protein
MLAAMLDAATGNAVMAKLPSHLTAVTTRLDTSFLKPAALGVSCCRFDGPRV